MTRLRRALRSRPGEDGFTMVELMAAMGVMLVALVAMLWTTLAGFRGVATARRRQTANSLANQTVEQVRALPFDTVKKGLSDSDSTVATDSAITSWTYKGESVPHASNPPTTPLNPHRQSVTRGNLT